MALSPIEYRLADFGSYTAGGRLLTVADRPVTDLNYTAQTRYRHDPNGTVAIEHAYVQYFVPTCRRALPPIVLVHGGGMSGSVWETTPDGRPGWLQALVAYGLETHVVDNVERGRAGWCALPNIWEGEPILRTIEESWSRFRFGELAENGALTAFDGQRFPVEHLDAFARSFVPRWTTTGELAARALVDIFERIGPCILVCHSQGGEAAFTAAAETHDLVKAIVAVEPTGFCAESSLSSVPTLLLSGDYIERSAHWRRALARQLDFKATIEGLGGRCDHISLPERGICGNTHMMMCDDNNDEIIDIVLTWLESVVEPAAAGCSAAAVK